ncbi:hypothetical protein [Chitinivibrio alkaliphilus]|uniref:Uncharacterized protein n=1 Tax=Chitinivibrio alkaliphilus ACht1 TaxID=1313304 RepID=U7D4M2_9BACT|nr:hypothetical protein [Chitinivibrio alkaliphilus]ERP31464.1 hypothetical protein CALK_1668 [Chitinivibrio alkaliphilus ACht1]
MDNMAQLTEIKKYQLFLSRFQNKTVDLNTAAFLWIRQYARAWRHTHPDDA